MSLVPLQPSLSRQVTEELLMRPTDAAEDDDDSYDEEDGMDSGDAFSNSALRKVAREVLSREGSSRLHTHTPTRQSVDEDTSAVCGGLLQQKGGISYRSPTFFVDRKFLVSRYCLRTGSTTLSENREVKVDCHTSQHCPGPFNAAITECKHLHGQPFGIMP